MKHYQAALKALDSWTPIACRSRTPIQRERVTKKGETRIVLYSHQWEPIADAPLTIAAACELEAEGLVIKCMRYEKDQELVVVRRVRALTP
jgi:hypothetical protein